MLYMELFDALKVSTHADVRALVPWWARKTLTSTELGITDQLEHCKAEVDHAKINSSTGTKTMATMSFRHFVFARSRFSPLLENVPICPRPTLGVTKPSGCWRRRVFIDMRHAQVVR